MAKTIDKLLNRMAMRLLRRSRRDVPPPAYAYGREEAHMADMRDGVRLLTHIMFPKPPGLAPGERDAARDAWYTQFPVIFTRSPYVEGFDPEKVLFRQFVPYGFIVCYQDVRGRGYSEGRWDPFKHERNDALDTLAWLRNQPWYGGRTALAGASYSAFCGLVWCDAWGGDIKTACLGMFGDTVHGAFYENGLFREDFFASWSLQNNEAESVKGDRAFRLQKKHEFLRPRSRLMTEVLDRPVPFYDALAAAPYPSDALWQDFLLPGTQHIRVPVCLITGWYDIDAQGMMQNYLNLLPAVRGESRLVIGPWSHPMINNGDKKTPNHAVAGLFGFRSTLNWLMHIFYDLKLKDPLGVQYYTLNKNRYTAAPALPAVRSYVYYISENDRYRPPEQEPDTSKRRKQKGPPAHCRGVLATRPYEGDAALSYRYDPEQPVPSCGGTSAAPAIISFTKRPKQCCAMQKKIREDVLVFKGSPLKKNMQVLGGKIVLTVSSDCPDTCFFVKLCAVECKKTYAFSYGIAALTYTPDGANPYIPGTKRTLTIPLTPVSYLIRRGSRLLLTVTSSDHPSYHLHPNTDRPWYTEPTAAVAQNTVYFEDSYAEIFTADTK